MVTINKDEVKRLVELFYQNPFKTFYVNSIDRQTFVKPIGVFVSLGITTSEKTMENISEIINNSEKYRARLVEIESKKVGSQYLNTIISDYPEQIHINTIQEGVLFLKEKDKGEWIMDEKFSRIELEKMKDLMHDDQDLVTLQTTAPKIQSLQGLITQIEDDPLGWDGYWIIKKPDGTFKLFHRYINYGDYGDVEYRVGIFVTPK